MVEMRGLGTGIFALTAAAVLLGCSPGELAVDSPSHERRFTKHLRGLNEDVTFVVKTNARGASSKYVLRADGRQQSAGQVRAEELAAHLKRFGHLTAELSDRYLNVATDTKIPVAIWFELDIERAEIRDGLRRGSPIARGLLAESIGVGGEGVLSRLNAWGIASRQYPVAPAIFANVTHAQAIELSTISGVRRIAYGGAGQQVTEELALIPSPGNSITSLSVDTEFNDQGFRGAGQGIGLVEQANCRLLIEHEIFDTLVGQFVEEPGGDFGCTTQGQCNHCAGFSVCANTECYDDHLSRIASVVLQNTDAGDYGAPEATVYHPTVGDGSNIACSADGITGAYFWLVDPQHNPPPTTTTESYWCGGGAEDGLAQDWFAREFGIAVFRAAGNEPELDVFEGCPTMNSVCVGGMRPDGSGWEIDPIASYLNPTTTHGDREEPDIVAVSESVETMEFPPQGGVSQPPTDLSGWGTSHGTSFSAPAAATFAVNLKTACGGTIDPKYLRAILMTSAWSINPDGPPYSTPGLDDYKDGAGAPDPSNALLFCGEGDSDIEVGGGPFNDDLDGGEDLPDWMEEAEMSAASAPALQPLGFNNTFGPNFVGAKLMDIELTGQDRIRVTLTWDTCPASGPTGNGPGDLHVDYDLFLCSPDSETCLGLSRSYDNNVEGFDVTVPEEQGAQAYEIWYGRDPETTTPCGSSSEPLAWAWAKGQVGFFQ